jgi:hypothetical protein
VTHDMEVGRRRAGLEPDLVISGSGLPQMEPGGDGATEVQLDEIRLIELRPVRVVQRPTKVEIEERGHARRGSTRARRVSKSS